MHNVAGRRFCSVKNLLLLGRARCARAMEMEFCHLQIGPIWESIERV